MKRPGSDLARDGKDRESRAGEDRSLGCDDRVEGEQILSFMLCLLYFGFSLLQTHNNKRCSMYVRRPDCVLFLRGKLKVQLTDAVIGSLSE